MPPPNQGRPFFTNFFAAFRAHAAVQKASSPATTAITSTLPTTRLPAPTTALPTSPTSTTATRSISTRRSTSSITISRSPSNSSLALSPPPAAPTPTFRSSRPLQSPYPAGTPQARGRAESTSSRHHDSPPPPRPNHGTTLPQALALPPTSCSSSNSSTTSPSLPVYGPSPFSHRSRTPSLTRQQARRGSDSSSDSGFPLSSSYSAGRKSKEIARTGAASWDMSNNAATSPEKWYIGGRTAQGEERFYKLGLVRRYGSEDRLSLDRLSL